MKIGKWTFLVRLLSLWLRLLSALPLVLHEERDPLAPDVDVPDPDDPPVDGAGDAVEALLVGLWKLVVLEDAVIEDILRGRGIDHVLDHKALDGLVLRNKTTAVHAVDSLLTAGVHLSTTTVPALLGHE